MSLPANIKALQVQQDHTVKVIEIPFSSQENVKNLPSDQVVIKVRAIGLNPTDWKHALTKAGEPGTIAGCDAAGDVVKVGSDVKHLKVGDRVAGFTWGAAWQKDNGAFAEYVRFYAAVTFKLPDGMSYEEGSSFPIPHLTAVQALYQRLALPYPSSPSSSPKPVLVWGGSTAVGHHAFQLAKLSGYKVYITASPQVHSELKSHKLGVAETFDYKASDVAKQIQAKDDGIKVALDTVAEKGTTDHVVDSISSNQGGTVSAILPPPDETKSRRKDVSADFTLVYTQQGYPFKFFHAFDFPASPEDKAASLKYVSEEWPKVVEGWKNGQATNGFTTQKLRKLEGGLEKVSEGLNIMKEGAYGREKLVYMIA